MSLEPEVVAMIAVVTAVVAVLMLAAVVVLMVRLRALRVSYSAAMGDAPGTELVGAVAAQAASLDRLRDDLGVVHRNTELLRDLQRGAVSRVGLVRYDAFPDMGGMLSFSAALLDERGDGVVLSAINGRQETRAYGKPMVGGTSEHTLSDEERAAVKAALDSGGVGSLTEPGVKKRRRV